MNKFHAALLRLSLVGLLTGLACSTVNSSRPNSPTIIVPTIPPLLTVVVPTLPPPPTMPPLPTVPPLPTGVEAKATPASAAAQAAGPAEITGEFKYSNDIITTYYVEQAVALVDMTGFVKRDLNWEIPLKSQTLGYLKIDTQAKTGTYWLQLPVHPDGQANNVSNDGQNDPGVQIFAVSYWPNLTGGPYSEGDDPTRGWPNYLASVKTDSANKDEVFGGKLVVWAPDANEKFPTDFGADGLLFTKDDPVSPLPAGYSIVDLDQKPFGISQPAQPTLELYEPKDAAIKDYSGLSYTAAFEQLFQKVSTEWAFNGIKGKEVDWKALHDQLAPKVADAEKNKDALAFYQAIHTFTQAIPDGHTGLGGGDAGNQDFQQQVSGGYGFAIREMDDGKVIVVYVLKNGPADKAGLQVGAEVTAFNGKPIADAIGAVQPYAGPFSMAIAKRYQQARYLLRAPGAGTNVSVTFANPQAASKTVSLTSVQERQSFSFTSLYRGVDPNALPVEAQILDSGAGYIKINSNYDDLALIIRLFQRALQTFEANQVTGLIIDLRHNSGGAPLGLAGFLDNKEIVMGQLLYYSEKTGQFEPEGLPEKFPPMQEQYKFDKIAILVSQACASACELEAYGFSKIPGAVVVGMYPSAGVEAEVSRGQFLLPDGMNMQIPTGRFINPDGSLFLEGVGVQPSVRIPITPENVLSTDDVELKAAEAAVAGK
jgi:C-terminal processing protease CtpA/Prc